MDKIKRRLEKLTGDVLSCDDPTSETGLQFGAELKLFQELSKTWKGFENAAISDERVKQRLEKLTDIILKPRGNAETFSADTYIEELKVVQEVVKTWNAADGIEFTKDESDIERKSSKRWDVEDGSLTTDISKTKKHKLNDKQKEAMYYLDCGTFDKFLALGGSGSGKSFIEAYKTIRDVLRHKAPCLIARDKLIDLSQGMIDQIVPAILQMIAEANGQERWDTWTIDGLRFAKWKEKKTVLEFATGGYVRFAGLSARDLTESGSDKILSPSWLHVMLEEISELDYEIVEKVLTRLRYHVDGVLNVLMMCENPPSINHWSYKRFVDKKREDGSLLSQEEQEQMMWLLMNPEHNKENLGETYIRNLKQMSGANRERFYLGQFQDSETGEIFKRMDWTDNMPRSYDWDRLVIYTDPTPLTGKEHSIWADYKASVLCGLFAGETFVIDIRIVKGSTLEMLQNIKQLWDVSPNQSLTDVVMEKKQVPSDFNQVMQTFAGMTGWVCPIKMDTRIFTDKKASIETFLQPLFENDMIHFNTAFRDSERGRQTQVQILKFSRKANKMLKDDIPDAIMRADTYLKGKFGKKRKRSDKLPLVGFVKPAYIHS